MPHNPRTNRWIQTFGITRGDVPRLLCFPHAGGSASFYHPLAVHVGAAAEVLAVQYPGRQERRAEPPLVRVDEMVDRIHAEIGQWTDRPLVFFGHSMGAVVAYEVARRLEHDGVRPLGVIASGRRAPSVHVEGNVHLRDDQGLVAEVRQLSGTANVLLDDEELRRMILPALRADYQAIETYRHRPGAELTCPITVLVGESDAHAALDDIHAWHRHTTGAFDLHVFPGGHFYLSSQWPAVAASVREFITMLTAAHSR